MKKGANRLPKYPSVLWLFVLVGSVERVYLEDFGRVLSCQKLEDVCSSTCAFRPQLH